jgi:hypothetical protein
LITKVQTRLVHPLKEFKFQCIKIENLWDVPKMHIRLLLEEWSPTPKTQTKVVLNVTPNIMPKHDIHDYKNVPFMTK